MTTPTDKEWRSAIDPLIEWFRSEDRGLPIKEVEKAISAYSMLYDQVADLRSQVERLHADGAVMEAACAAFRQGLEDSGCEEVKGVLSNEVGRYLLARYREAVKLLEETSVEVSFDTGDCFSWCNRRDTLLAKVKGEVEL